jgi:hypothetical protein
LINIRIDDLFYIFLGMEDIRAVIDVGNGYIKGVVFAEDEGKKIVLAKDMVKTQ